MFPTHPDEPAAEQPASTKAAMRFRRLSKKALADSSDNELMEKLKKSKEEASLAQQAMVEALQKYRQLQNQISKNDRLAHLAKANCMKLYEVKKQRLLSKSLIEDVQ